MKPELSSRQSECQRQGAKTNLAQVQAAICARQEQMHDGSVTPAAITLSARICIEMNKHAVTFLPPSGARGILSPPLDGENGANLMPWAEH